MPMLRFACPKCGTVHEAAENSAGRKLACSKCGQRLQVPPVPASKTVMGTPLPEPPAPAAQPTPVTARSGAAVQSVFACPRCGQTYQVNRDVAGKRTTCPKCGQLMVFT